MADPKVFPTYNQKIHNRRKAFIAHYLRCFNATESARKAGFVGSPESLGVTGARILRDARVQAALRQRLERMNISADETLARIALQATADLSPFIVCETHDDSGKMQPCKAFVDVKAIIAAGKGHLIKEIGYTKAGDVIVKTHDQQKALELIGKAHGLFKERNEHTGLNGGPIQVQPVAIDYSRLSIEELRVMLAVAEKLQLPSGASNASP